MRSGDNCLCTVDRAFKICSHRFVTVESVFDMESGIRNIWDRIAIYALFV